MLKFDANGFLSEEQYIINNEAKAAALFTVGNGYMGVRGSFEEFGSLRIQGVYVRGFIDEIIEIIEPFADTEYMKKYYLNEDALKDFEKQESCINIADILYLRVTIDGKTFYPWQGTIVKWNRYLDPCTASLVREVEWDNGDGLLTKLTFTRFASYADEHLFCQKVTVTPLNHDRPVEIFSGIDTRVKTNGQKVTKKLVTSVQNNICKYVSESGSKFKFKACVLSKTKFYNGNRETAPQFELNKGGILACGAAFQTKRECDYSAEKTLYLNTSRDYSFNADMEREAGEKLNLHAAKRYSELFAQHCAVWTAYFENMDVKIAGDSEADAALRFASYHTAISASFRDSVHGISAKTLSGERYNSFVWWDCEIYQLPIFIHTYPEAAKNELLYRYRLLDESRKQAKSCGLKGAKYAFCSSVTGEEKVWSYARHPFLQIHINADIAFGVINYYAVTGDTGFMTSYGAEMLAELGRFWVSRAEKCGGKYVIKNVTGTDEHHPYVNNDAYTNYLVQYVLKTAPRLIAEFAREELLQKLNLTDGELAGFTEVADNLFLPVDENGRIPQFDGYFSLSPTLEVVDGSSAASFQMKASGLYHKSQVIKQPDVMLLYSYLNLLGKGDCYADNWDYYERMCESSSSLSFPVHAICSADNGRMESFKKYFMEALRIDIDDLHHCAWQGVHAGCIAGGWYSVFRGVMGIVCREDGIEIAPNVMPDWKSAELCFRYRGALLRAKMEGGKLTLTPEERNDKVIPVRFCGKPLELFNTAVVLEREKRL